MREHVETLSDLQVELATRHLSVHQPSDPVLMMAEPVSAVRAHRWRWADIAVLARRVLKEIPLEPGGDRRTIRLVNPGLESGTTDTLWAAIQQVQPGETATAHRHTPSAFRFVIQGSGAVTTVNGVRYAMHEGDLLLTPNWSWHDHTNVGAQPMLWLDGLDLPLVRALHAVFFEPYWAPTQPVNSGPSSLASREEERGVTSSDPLLVFGWDDAFQALTRRAYEPTDPFDDVVFEYRDEGTGRPVLPTIGLALQMLRPGITTQLHRHTSSAVYHVVRGRGCTKVGGRSIEWAERDFFVVPPWTWHRHINRRAEEASVLFQMNDVPTLRTLGLYREEAEPRGSPATSG